MKKSNVLKLIGASGLAVAGVIAGICAVKRVKEIKEYDADFDLDDDDDYDSDDFYDDDEEDYDSEEENTEFVDDFPDDDDQEEAPTEDDIFQEQTDNLENLTDEEKFESVCGLSPKDVKAILSLKYSEDELNSKSLEELSQLYLQEA